MAEACLNCGKTEASMGQPLKQCSKCKAAKYCSRDCQKDHWKSHKKVCGAMGQDAAKNPPPPSSARPSRQAPTGPRLSTVGGPTKKSKVLKVTIAKPFNQLLQRAWLHNRPEEDVYKLLVDTYRLRVEDTYVFEGDLEPDSIYGGATDGGIRGFSRFLNKVESHDGLLPSWWTPDHRQACIAYGARSDEDHWSGLCWAVEKHDIVDHYDDPLMPMQIRMFSEQVYGYTPGAANGAAMLKMQADVENGRGPTHVTNIDWSGTFTR